MLLSLSTRVPATETRPLAAPGGKPRLAPVEILPRASGAQDGDVTIHEGRLHSDSIAALVVHPRIRLSMATYATDAALESGELAFTGTACRFRTPPGEELRDNASILFVREPGCTALAETTAGDVVLTLRLNHPGHVAVWTLVTRDPQAVPPDALTAIDPGLSQAGETAVVRGDVRDEYPDRGTTRLALLAAMWELSSSSAWIVALVCLCGLLIGRAVWGGWATGAGSRAGVLLRTSEAVFLLTLGVSACYAVIFPPFQAADEPNHFLALTSFLGRPDMSAETAAWARRTAFEEIRFNADRPFSPLDRGRSGAEWTAVGVPDDIRGAGMRLVWFAAAPVARKLTVQQLFLSMRLLHAVIFATAVSLFVALAASFTGAGTPVLLAIPLLLVPTLPYFGMHMSNYAPLLATYVLLAAGALIATWDGAGSYAAGPVLGVALALAIAFSRSSLPLVPFVAVLLGARALLGDRSARPWTAWVFWLGCAATLGGGLTLIEGKYLGALQSGSGQVSRSAAVMGFMLHRPWLVVIPLAAALLIELSTTRWRGRGAGTAGGSWVRWLAGALAVAMLASLVASWWVHYPTLEGFDPNHRPPAWHYVRHATVACLTFLRFGHPDNLTSISFFGGFGWLETLAPDALVSTLAGASGVSLVLLLVWIARERDGRALGWVLFAAAGFAVSAAAYALTIIKVMPADLHGRYLLGLYVSVLVICWSGVARIAGAASRAWMVVIGAAACCIAVNAWSLTFILARYF